MIEYSEKFFTEPPNVTTTAEPQFQGDDVKFIIVPIVVIVVVMLLSLLVYYMAKRRKLQRLRRENARWYECNEKDLEWEPLDSFEYPSYNSISHTPMSNRSTEDNDGTYLLTTNL